MKVSVRLPGGLGTRGLKGALRRALAIARRHGLTPDRMLRQVSEFTRTALSYGMRPTFPIIASRSVTTSTTLRTLQDAGAIFACHGLRHVDYTLLPKADQSIELGRAIEMLTKSGIRISGFRAPYLRTNDNLREVVAEHGFGFDSSEGVLWPLAGEYADHPSTRAAADFYNAPVADGAGPLPADGAVVRVPVSLPDDEMCAERMGLPPKAIGRQWCENLTAAFDRGAVYVLQLHPERFALLREAAEELMDLARHLSPRLWLATPAEIAEWWRRREDARVRFRRIDGRWIARVEGAADVCLELVDAGGEPSPPRQPIPAAREFTVNSTGRPAVGLSRRVSPEMARRVREEGFPCELLAKPGEWSCYLDLAAEAAQISRTELLETVIERSSGPLVRLSRWPNGCRAAFSVTGDIDALCLPDFFSRLRG